ncbi:MAG: MFS transporter [Clostridia bacterium]|nr:MFS transporter [Clostridia bacterium]
MAREYLKGGMFDRPEWQTHVKTNRITTKERILGHMIGPGLVYFFYSTFLGLRELFYMDVLRINEVFNNALTYLIMTTVTSIIGIGTGFFIAHMTEKTVCKAGRFRPYVLIGTWIMAIAGFFVFWSPFAPGSAMQLVWLYTFNILFTAVGVPLWNLRANVVSMISRNVLERNNVTTIRSAVNVMIAGTIGALGIVGFLYPNVLQKDLTGTSWYITIGACALTALGFSFMEYFWTRERITEDNQKILADESGDAAINVPFLQQVKNLVTNKYYLLSILVLIGVTFYDNIQGGNARVNMITYILGGNAENNFQFTYLLASMQPMAIGAVVVPILAKRFSARKIMLISSIITLAGIAIALINPYSFLVAVAGGFVFACGIFAITNMNAVFGQQANDNLEYKYGYRPEGTLAVGLISTVITTLMTPLNAVYETGLSLNGYVAGAVQQPQAVNNWILMAYYGAYGVFAVIMLIVCIFFDLEKKMPEIHAALRERAKKAAEDRGEVYVSPEEQDRLEMEAAAKELEAARVADLKELCAKKGLDFETENRKYLEKQAAKQAKAAKKQKK